MADGTQLIDTARERFEDLALAAYGSSVADDCMTLETVAGMVAAFVDQVEPHFRKLDVARDRPTYQGPVRRWERSRWDRAYLIEALAEVLANATLNDEAAGVLVSQAQVAAFASERGVMLKEVGE